MALITVQLKLVVWDRQKQNLKKCSSEKLAGAWETRILETKCWEKSGHWIVWFKNPGSSDKKNNCDGFFLCPFPGGLFSIAFSITLYSIKW
jgi:hypothetical protein